jgi:hypothetical protein
MKLQGSLQNILDALYDEGILGSVIQEDWEQLQRRMAERGHLVARVFGSLQNFEKDRLGLKTFMGCLDMEMKQFIAMEVGRELAEQKTYLESEGYLH